MPAVPKYKMVHLLWEDSHGSNEWIDAEEAASIPLQIQTVGYLIRKAERYTVVASSFSENNQLTGVLKIPNSCILKRRILK